MIYKEILERLEKSGIHYLVVGGVAVNLHGVERFTGDLDVILSLDLDSLEKFSLIMNDLGYKTRIPADPKLLANPEIRKDWVENKHMKAFSFYHHKEQQNIVDIVISHPLNFEIAYGKREDRRIYGISVPVVSFDDLVSMKREASRPKDKLDLEMLDIVQSKKKGSRNIDVNDWGYFDTDDYKVGRYMGIPDETKLDWLEEARLFQLEIQKSA
jgi:hypothetical protein